MVGYLKDAWSKKIPWMDKTGKVLLTFNSSVNPVLYSMRMKQFRKHLRDMLLCKKRQRRGGQSAEVCVGPPLNQQVNRSEKCARNPAAGTLLSFSPAFKQELFTAGNSLELTKYRREPSITARAAVDEVDLETATCTTELSQRTKK